MAVFLHNPAHHSEKNVSHVGDVQKNSKVGFTVVVPFRGRNAIKLGYAIGAHTEYGGDFDQYLVVYQRVLK